ncbi:MAG: AbrB family transcriptional regulator [Bacteriovoracaceae bacterium]|nr:AbrB family transcriptional regulator [Bacteriovoracaceae bacterium]
MGHEFPLYWSNPASLGGALGHATLFARKAHRLDEYYFVSNTFYMSTTVTQKGQVTIPKEIRDFLGIRPGQKVSFQIEGDHAVVKKGEQPIGIVERWVGFGKGKLRGFKNVDAYLAKTRGRNKRQ